MQSAEGAVAVLIEFELIERARGGDESAFNQVLQAYRTAVSASSDILCFRSVTPRQRSINYLDTIGHITFPSGNNLARKAVIHQQTSRTVTFPLHFACNCYNIPVR